MMRFIFALLLLLGAPAPARAPSHSVPSAILKPALWKLSDPDTTIWLFGSIHLLTADKNWLTGPVAAAFDQADTLVLETRIPDPETAQAAIAKYAFDPGTPLAARLDPKLAARLQARMTADRLPPASLSQARPWFAAIMIEQLAYARMGLDAAHGVEQRLSTRAAEQRKTVLSLEGFDEQIAFLATLAPDLQIKLLRSTLDETDEAPKQIAQLITDWSRGDIDKLAGEINKETAKMPELRSVLIDQRNARWADWIAKRLDQPGKLFIAVGAGHLGGAGSLRALLQAKGYKIERLQ